MELSPALYMVPVSISEAPLSEVIPDDVRLLSVKLKYYIVENEKIARRFLKRCDRNVNINDITFFELNKHTDPRTIDSFLDPLREGCPVGMMSDAGCPGIADPGAAVAKIAQSEGLRVCPLVGPSSIFLALMASGFNGQGFCFNGYLPLGLATAKKVRELEFRAYKESMTQIFIETPYRNNKTLELVCRILRPETLLCVASMLTDPENESVVVKTAKEWRRSEYDYDKKPAIFLIYHP